MIPGIGSFIVYSMQYAICGGGGCIEAASAQVQAKTLFTTPGTPRRQPPNSQACYAHERIANGQQRTATHAPQWAAVRERATPPVMSARHMPQLRPPTVNEMVC
eukprot:scaffold27568_cov129-Isochrysis_galbana.AAC.3